MQPITTIRNAVSYLGIDMLRTVVMSAETFRLFGPGKNLPGSSPEALQHHAQLTAALAKRLPVPKYVVELTVLAALLHDVGKLALAIRLPAQFTAPLDAARHEGRPFYALEPELFGASHAEIGPFAVSLCGLPYTIIEAVAYHHAPTSTPRQNVDTLAAP